MLPYKLTPPTHDELSMLNLGSYLTTLSPWIFQFNLVLIYDSFILNITAREQLNVFLPIFTFVSHNTFDLFVADYER